VGTSVKHIEEAKGIESRHAPRQQRILYVCHVDWGWIKQRPQHIAEQLRQFFDVRVLFNHNWKRGNLPNKFRISPSCLPLLHIPLRRFVPALAKLDAFTTRLMVQCTVSLLRPDFIWLTWPDSFEYLPKRLKASLVYDCMDDVLTFPRNVNRIAHLERLERALVDRAAIVFVSSKRLQSVLEARHHQPQKYHLLRNAFDGKILPGPKGKHRSAGVFTIGYCGTIAPWCDWELLIKLVNAKPEVEVHLVGPVDDGASVVAHPRIVLRGAATHSALPAIMDEFDCLLMPFQVTPLIESVDPVKLYEYINFGKPIVSVYYDEIARFAPFVHFYRSHDQALEIVSQLAAGEIGRKYSDVERRDFLSKNSWMERASVAVVLLKAIGEQA
jgi:hypothetical protein